MKIGDIVEFGDHPLNGILAGKGRVVKVAGEGTLVSVWLFRQKKVKVFSHLLLSVVQSTKAPVTAGDIPLQDRSGSDLTDPS